PEQPVRDGTSCNHGCLCGRYEFCGKQFTRDDLLSLCQATIENDSLLTPMQEEATTIRSSGGVEQLRLVSWEPFLIQCHRLGGASMSFRLSRREFIAGLGMTAAATTISS